VNEISSTAVRPAYRLVKLETSIINSANPKKGCFQSSRKMPGAANKNFG
jgi:hypothetical protein